ncbi:MAG TPA: magnesium transporter, partial [Actinomycetota bacterium]|nr:magnesium transporter [Actinomycetota bacterium]
PAMALTGSATAAISAKRSIAGIYGMNLIVPSATDPLHIAGVLFFMLLVTVGMLRYARRQGWW